MRLQDSFKLTDHYGSDVMSAFAFIDVLTASETDDTKKGMAIGKAAEVEGAVDIGWNLIARKGFTWQGMPLTYFTPTVNVSGEYYGKYGCYAKDRSRCNRGTDGAGQERERIQCRLKLRLHYRIP